MQEDKAEKDRDAVVAMMLSAAAVEAHRKNGDVVFANVKQRRAVLRVGKHIVTIDVKVEQ